MGVDLTLVVDRYNQDSVLAYDRLGLDRIRDLWDQIRELSPRGTEKEVWWYEDGGVRKTWEDAYGEKLTYLLAGDFKQISAESTGGWNASVIKFIRSLPYGTKIYLWWH